MQTDVFDWAETLRATNNLDDFWSEASRLYRDMGVTSVFYGFIPSKADVEAHGITKSSFFRGNHPAEWIEQLGEDTFLDNDLSAEFTLLEEKPFVWHHEEQWDDATPEQQAQSNFERDINLAVGITMPTASFRKEHIGAVSLNMTSFIREEEFDGYWTSYQEKLSMLGYLLDSGMRGPYLSDFVNLTPRQLEILRLQAVGLADIEIGHRLNISPKTVGHHAKSMYDRLKVGNRAHAVARGLLLDLIKL